MVDVVVVGSGPNGLAAAITCAAAGRSVLVLEGADTIGGGTRSAALTLPGFVHDVCSAVHPLTAVSPFFQAADLGRHGLELVHPDIPLVHPLDDGRAGVLHRSVDDTVQGLGEDGRAWARHVGWSARRWDDLAPGGARPVAAGAPPSAHAWPAFGARGILPATVAGRAFSTDEARGLFAGAAAHCVPPAVPPVHHEHGPDAPGLGARRRLAQRPGRVADHRRRHGVPVSPSSAARSRRGARSTPWTTSRTLGWSSSTSPPGSSSASAAMPCPTGTGAGWAASSTALASSRSTTRCPHPCPGRTRTPAGRGASTSAARSGRSPPPRPTWPPVATRSARSCWSAQPSLFDPTRRPAGQHTLWTYCHVPARSTLDMTEAIEGQIERFAPGFRDVVLARHIADSSWFEAYNPNIHRR